MRLQCLILQVITSYEYIQEKMASLFNVKTLDTSLRTIDKQYRCTRAGLPKVGPAGQGWFYFLRGANAL